MVLLSTIKQLLHPEQLFEKGHPVQLLLYLFNQFNQESVILLLNQIETTLPSIPNEAKQLIERAENIFDAAFQKHQYYEKATDEEKEYIEHEIKRKRQEIKKEMKKNKKSLKLNKKNNDNDNKETEEDDIKLESDDDNNHNNDNNKDNKDINKDNEWMDIEEFQICDLYFRKSCKLAPKCIKSHIKYIKFLFQCNKISIANQIYKKTLIIIRNVIKSKNNNNSKISKRSKTKKKQKKSKYDGINILNLEDLNKLETLIIFYMGYLYYMHDDIISFNKLLKQCLDREPDNIGMRCQYVVCLTTSMEYEKAYIYLIETLKLLQNKEKQYITNDDVIDMVKHYNCICGIGCAAIRCVFGVDWNMVTEHLQFVMDNDQSNVGVLKYCISYTLYKNGKYQQSMEYYNKFVNYINIKKAEAEKQKKNREIKMKNKNKTEIDDDRTENEIQKDAMNDAAAQLNMDSFKWHPNSNKDNISEILDVIVDFIAVCIIIMLFYGVTGYRPHLGNKITDWFIITMMLLISCALITPSLGILLMAVSLPPYNHNISNPEFGYTQFFTKWLCVSAGLLFVYKVVIAGEMPTKRMF